MKKTLFRMAIIGTAALAAAGCKKEEAPAPVETATAEAATAEAAPSEAATTGAAEDGSDNHNDMRGPGGN